MCPQKHMQPGFYHRINNFAPVCAGRGQEWK